MTYRQPRGDLGIFQISAWAYFTSLSKGRLMAFIRATVDSELLNSI